MWSLMKWCQLLGWVQKDRPPRLRSFRLPSSFLQATRVSIVCDSPSPLSGRRSVRKPVTAVFSRSISCEARPQDSQRVWDSFSRVS